MHIQLIEDNSGDVVDAAYFCIAECHRDFCAHEGIEYGGWNGAHEGPEHLTYCRTCGVRLNVGIDANGCDWACIPFVVRVVEPTNSTCSHGVDNYIGWRKG